MGRKSLAPERMTQILDAYEQLILKRGFAAVTLEEVAEAAGVKRPLIRHYFGNRSDVVRELVRRLVRRVDHELERRIVGERPEEVTESLVDALIEEGRGGEPGEAAVHDRLFNELFGAGLTDAVVREELTGVTTRWHEEFVSLYRWIGTDASADDVAHAATLTLCLIFGLGTYRLLGLGELAEVAIRDQLETLIRNLRGRAAPEHEGAISSQRP